jgi:hypothetical protein
VGKDCRRSGVFVVLRVDAEVGTADVLLLTGILQIGSGVQLALMQTLGEQQRADLMKFPAAGELVGRRRGPQRRRDHTEASTARNGES